MKDLNITITWLASFTLTADNPTQMRVKKAQNTHYCVCWSTCIFRNAYRPWKDLMHPNGISDLRRWWERRRSWRPGRREYRTCTWSCICSSRMKLCTASVVVRKRMSVVTTARKMSNNNLRWRPMYNHRSQTCAIKYMFITGWIRYRGSLTSLYRVLFFSACTISGLSHTKQPIPFIQSISSLYLI